jgi:hypothetical protein
MDIPMADALSPRPAMFRLLRWFVLLPPRPACPQLADQLDTAEHHGAITPDPLADKAAFSGLVLLATCPFEGLRR